MAITVASDQTLVNTTGGDAESYTNWTETAAWSTAGVIDGDMYLQGSNTIGARASAAAGPIEAVFWSHLTTGTANLNLTGYHIYFWIKCITLPSMDTRARGGIGLSVSSTAAVALDATAPWTTLPWRGVTDSNQWFLTGNDIDGTSGWVCYVVDPFSTPDFARNTPVMTSVDRIGIRAAVLQVVGAGSFKPKNVLWDAIRYGTKLTITGSTGTFQDIFAADNTTANQFGILRKSSGIFLGGGKLIFGTTGQSAPCVFTDTKQTLVWQDFRVASTFYEIQLVGNTTPNTTTVTMGTYSGGLTSGGCTIRGVGLDTQRLIAPVIVGGGTTYVVGDILTVVGGTGTVAAQFEVYAVSSGVITAIVMKTAGSYSVPPTGTLTVTDARNSSATFTATVVGGSIWTLTASASNQTLNLYNCTLSQMLSAALATTTTIRGSTFIDFGTITTNGALIDNCTFQDLRTATPISATNALVVNSTSEVNSKITNNKFINCGRAVKITAAGTYTFDNLTFSGNTYDIENSSGGRITINTSNGANPTTYLLTAGTFGTSSCQSYNANTTTYTDETADINNATVNDVLLPPIQATTSGDITYFGHSATFTDLTVDVGTAGVYSNITMNWEYWNGAWVALTVTDNTTGFTVSGINRVAFDPPGDWATTAVNGTTKYWVRARSSWTSGQSITTAPKATQGWQGSTNIVTSASLIINIVDADGTAITADCEVTVVKNSDAVVLYHEDGITDGSTTYTYNSGGGTVTYINVHNITGYQSKTINNYTLPSSGTTTLTVQLDDDLIYSNPA